MKLSSLLVIGRSLGSQIPNCQLCEHQCFGLQLSSTSTQLNTQLYEFECETKITVENAQISTNIFIEDWTYPQGATTVTEDDRKKCIHTNVQENFRDEFKSQKYGDILRIEDGEISTNGFLQTIFKVFFQHEDFAFQVITDFSKRSITGNSRRESHLTKQHSMLISRK